MYIFIKWCRQQLQKNDDSISFGFPESKINKMSVYSSGWQSQLSVFYGRSQLSDFYGGGWIKEFCGFLDSMLETQHKTQLLWEWFTSYIFIRLGLESKLCFKIMFPWHYSVQFGLWIIVKILWVAKQSTRGAWNI